MSRVERTELLLMAELWEFLGQSKRERLRMRRGAERQSHRLEATSEEKTTVCEKYFAY